MSLHGGPERTAEILFPVIRFEAEIYPFGRGQPSPLERAALFFVASQQVGKEGVELQALADFLKIGSPATTDLFVLAWRYGWLVVNPNTGRLLVPDWLLRRLEAAKQPDDLGEALGTTEPPIRLGFIYDLVTGQVGPDCLRRHGTGSQDRTFPPIQQTGRESLLPEEAEDASAAGQEPYDRPLDGFLRLTAAEFGRALARHPDYRRLGNPGSRMTYQVLPIPVTPASVEFITLDFVVRRVPGSRSISLAPVDRSGSDDARERARERERQIFGVPLARAVAELAELDDAQNGELSDVPRFRRGAALIARLQEIATERSTGIAMTATRPLTRLREALSGNAVNAAALASLWEEARAELLETASNRLAASIRPLPDTAAVERELRQILRAEDVKQVVIVSPEVDRERLIAPGRDGMGAESLLDALKRARRSKHVYLQMRPGRGGDESGAAQLLGAEIDGERRPGQTGSFTRRTLEGRLYTRASLVAVDAKTLLLSSRPFFGRAHPGAFGLRLDFALPAKNGETGGSAFMIRLLRRVGADFLDLDILRAITAAGLSAAGSGRVPEALAALDAFRQLDRLRLAPTDHDFMESATQPEFDQSAADPTHTKLRRQEDIHLVEALSGWAERDSNSVDLLLDSEIQDRAVTILDTAADRTKALVVIAGDEITEGQHFHEAKNLVDSINRFARRGQVTIVLPAWSDATQAKRDQKLRDFEQLLERDVRRLAIEGEPGRLLSFILTSEGCVVASGGLVRRRINRGTRRSGTEIGLALSVPDPKKTLEEAFRHAVPLAAWTGLETPPRRRRAESSLFALYDAWTARQFDDDLGVEALVNALGDSTTPMPDTSDLSLPEEFSYAVLKARTIRYFADGNDGRAPHELARHYWKTGDLGHAAAFAEWLPDTPLADKTIRHLCFAYCMGSQLQARVVEEIAASEPKEVLLALTALLMLDNLNPELAYYAELVAAKAPEGPIADLVSTLAQHQLNGGPLPELSGAERQIQAPLFKAARAKLNNSALLFRDFRYDHFNAIAVRDAIFDDSTKSFGWRIIEFLRNSDERADLVESFLADLLGRDCDRLLAPEAGGARTKWAGDLVLETRRRAHIGELAGRREHIVNQIIGLLALLADLRSAAAAARTWDDPALSIGRSLIGLAARLPSPTDDAPILRELHVRLNQRTVRKGFARCPPWRHDGVRAPDYGVAPIKPDRCLGGRTAAG